MNRDIITQRNKPKLARSQYLPIIAPKPKQSTAVITNINAVIVPVFQAYQ